MYPNTTTPSILRNPDVAEGAAAVEAPVVAEEKPDHIMLVNPTTGEEEKHMLDESGKPFIVKNGVTLTIHEFTGDNKGVLFYAASFGSLAGAVQLHGEAAILDALNDSMLSGTRKKVKRTKIPNFDDAKAQADHIKKMVEKEPIQFTQEEALAYKPGERELSSNQIMSLIKQRQKEGANRKELRQLFDDLMEANDRERALKGIIDEEDNSN